MKTKFKWLFITLAGLLGVVIGCLYFTSQSGNSAFDDRDLRVVRREVPAAENAFSLLTNAAVLLHWPEEMPESLSDALNHKSWDPIFMDGFLATNTAALELWTKAASLPRLQVPQPFDWEEEYDYLTHWRTLGNLATLSAQDLSRRGDDVKAFALALQVVEFGHAIEECGGGHIHYFVGSNVKILGLKSLARLTPGTRLSPRELDDYVSRLDAFTANGTGFTNSVKQEYTLQSTSLRNLFSTNSGRFRIFPQPMFNPIKTDRLNGNSRLLLLALFEKPYADDSLRKLVAGSTNRSPFRRWLRGNAVGSILHEMSLPAQEKFLARKAQENVWVRATQVLLACKSFKMRTGRLPFTLDELVPNSLPAIPRDDFDGKPLRYSARDKLIYSVAEDLIDSKGTNFNSARKRLDLPFKIEF